MAKLKLESAIKDMSEFLETIGIDGTFQYIGGGNVLIRSRRFKDNEELYDPVKSEVYLKGLVLKVQDINDSHYPALIFDLEELLKCKYQGGVKKELYYVVTPIDGYEIVDEDYIIDILDLETINLPIEAVEVTDRYLEFELTDIDSITDADINERMTSLTNSQCVIDREHSTVTISIFSMIYILKPDVDVKMIDGRIFASIQESK